VSGRAGSAPAQRRRCFTNRDESLQKVASDYRDGEYWSSITVLSLAALLKVNLINLRIGYNKGAFSGVVGNKDFLKTSNSEQRL
jgi:hypothetical protein